MPRSFIFASIFLILAFSAVAVFAFFGGLPLLGENQQATVASSLSKKARNSSLDHSLILSSSSITYFRTNTETPFIFRYGSSGSVASGAVNIATTTFIESSYLATSSASTTVSAKIVPAKKVSLAPELSLGTTSLSVRASPVCGGRLSVSWSKIKDAKSYELFADDGSDPIYTGKNNSFDIEFLDPASAHAYKVRGLASVGGGTIHFPFSSVVSGSASLKCELPSPILKDVSASISACNIKSNLEWQPVAGASMYSVYRNGKEIANGVLSAMFSDSIPLSGASVQYKVRAMDGTGRASDFSNSKSISFNGVSCGM